LETAGIHTEIHYPQVAAMEAECYLNISVKKYPKSEQIAHKVMSLPVSPWHSNEEIILITSKVNELLVQQT
jgi:dTDP-4-amino-4,6-dideoxygalactose transaminase